MKTKIAILIIIILTNASIVNARSYELPDFYSQVDETENVDCGLIMPAVNVGDKYNKNAGLLASASNLNIVTYEDGSCGFVDFHNGE